MGAIPEQSFTVRKPAWWDTDAEYVIQDYPGRDEAMRLAGHDFQVVERPVFVVGNTMSDDKAMTEGTYLTHPDGKNGVKMDTPFKALVKSGTGEVFTIVKDTYEVIPNSVPYDVAEALLDEGFLYETGGSLNNGALCYLTLLLNEPVVIPGDDSTTLPYAGLSWSHDGTASFSIRSTSVRQVCENTVSASEAEGNRLGTNYVFRHTKNVMERIEEARKTIKGVRENHGIYVEAMTELAAMPVTPDQRDMFVSAIVGDKDGILSTNAATSNRVKNNIEAERAKINGLFFGPTIPEAHNLTGYGLHLAGVEYFDHLRGYRSQDSYVKRTLLTDNPAKAALIKTIRECVAA